MKHENLGALWIVSSESQRAPFASGSIQITDRSMLDRLARGEKLPIVVWKDNREKNGKKYPDFVIQYDSYYDERRQDIIDNATDDIY
ncbi:MAG TPA: hypothetical protein PK712_07305 [Rectinema sp.]|jgi:hypothetical protein|nr:hypothetical protein [Rectinema sp.]